MNELEKLIMEIISELHAQTALPPELIVEESGMIRM
jgi:hypothetical protein